MDDHRYRIDEVEEKTGLTKRMLRYYEELGIITPDRSEGNYRNYSGDDIETLVRMREIKDKLGFSMEELKSFAGIRSRISGLIKGEKQDRAAIKSCQDEVDRLIAILDDKERVIKRTRARLTAASTRLGEVRDKAKKP
jgi:DNA-binding transcriptional MerR regulator